MADGRESYIISAEFDGKGLEKGKKQIEELSKEAEKGGKALDDAFAGIDKIVDTNKKSIKQLEEELKRLRTVSGEAFARGDDKTYRESQQKAQAISSEIALRKQLIAEAEKSADELNALSKEEERSAVATERVSESTQRATTQLRAMREELAQMERNGKRGTAEYEKLADEAGKLADSISDAQRQIQILSSDEKVFQGVVSGLNGVAGAASAVQGAMGLLVGENEDLQRVMLKVQSLMAITTGLQQVEQALNKDSAFRLVIVNGLKAQLATVTGVYNASLAAEAARTGVASTANLGFAASLRAVGAAIKSIPFIGWAAALAGAVVSTVAWIAHTNKATKSQEDLAKEAEKAKKAMERQKREASELSRQSGELLATFNLLSIQWKNLATEQQKNQFIKDNASAFDALGVSVNNINDAYNVLVKNAPSVVDALVAMAKAEAYKELYKENVKRQVAWDNRKKSRDTGDHYDAVDLGKNKRITDEEAEYLKSKGLKKGVDYQNPLLEKGQLVMSKKAVDEITKYRREKARELKKSFEDDIKEQGDAYIKGMTEAQKEVEESQKKLTEVGIKSNTKNGSISTSKTTRDKEDALKRQAQLSEEEYKQKKDAERKKIDLELAARQMELDAEKDSASKRMEQLKLNYAKRKEEIKREEEDIYEQNYEAAKKLYELENKDKQFGGNREDYRTLTDEQKKYLEAANKANVEVLTNGIKDEVSQQEEYMREYLEKYGTLQEQKLAITQKYAKLIEEAERQGYKGLAERYRQEERQATSDADFNEIKRSPEFARAFSNPADASVDTLKTLIKLFGEKMNDGSLSGLSPEQMQAWVDAWQSMYDNMVSRDPFAALAESSERLRKAEEGVVKITRKIAEKEANKYKTAIKDGKAVIEIDKEYVELQKELARAQNDVADAQRNHQKAVDATIAEVNKLSAAISSLGDTIGGTEGEILKCIAQTMDFATSTMQGISQLAEITSSSISATMKAIESASVILAIVGAAIQLMQAISQLVQSEHDEYEALAEKQAKINELTDSVNNYAIAVAKAAADEKEWFGSSSISRLQNQWEVNKKALDSYNAKLNERQEEYVDEDGSGWLTKSITWVTGAVGKVAGVVGRGLAAVGTAGVTEMTKVGDKVQQGVEAAAEFSSASGTAIFTALEGIASEDRKLEDLNGVNALADTLGIAEKNAGRLKKAFENMRIETREASSGFLGTGIGGHKQQTEDLRDWIRNNFNDELFNQDNSLNTELAKEILEDYGDKLVGETKKTLEKLVKLQEEVDEYKKQIRDVVSEMYGGLADNLTDALWDWYKEGTDVLQKFKNAAGETFEQIAKDAVKNAVLSKIFDGYSDNIAEIYDKYIQRGTSEEEMIAAVANETKLLTSGIEDSLPILQQITQSIGDTIAEAGYANNGAIEASRKSVASMSEDTASELNGRFTAIQLSTNNMEVYTKQISENVAFLQNISTAMDESNGVLRDIHASILACNGTLNSIYNANVDGFNRLVTAVNNVNSTINNKL